MVLVGSCSDSFSSAHLFWKAIFLLPLVLLLEWFLQVNLGSVQISTVMSVVFFILLQLWLFCLGQIEETTTSAHSASGSSLVFLWFRRNISGTNDTKSADDVFQLLFPEQNCIGYTCLVPSQEAKLCHSKHLRASFLGDSFKLETAMALHCFGALVRVGRE